MEIKCSVADTCMGEPKGVMFISEDEVEDLCIIKVIVSLCLPLYNGLFLEKDVKLAFHFHWPF